jgi:hypothetical protein
MSRRAFEGMPWENSETKVVEPYERGVVAARMGLSEDSNPYKPGTNEFSDWRAGFEDFVDDADFLETS